jgi:glyoxylase-like metal-dependent hydrolase (beta-lactamase superfamily II)
LVWPLAARRATPDSLAVSASTPSMRSVAAFLPVGSLRCAVVSDGQMRPSLEPPLAAFFTPEAGVPAADLAAVVFTHLHQDHCRGVTWSGHLTFPQASAYVLVI